MLPEVRTRLDWMPLIRHPGTLALPVSWLDCPIFATAQGESRYLMVPVGNEVFPINPGDRLEC